MTIRIAKAMEMTIWINLFKSYQHLVTVGHFTVEYESIKWRNLAYFLNKLDLFLQGSQSVLVKEIIPVIDIYTFHHT